MKSFRGEALGYARFEGVYLPLLWEQSFCVRTPIALGYTRGHFSALVPLEPYSRLDTRPSTQHSNIGADQLQSTFLPLMDRDRKLLPIHFLTESEVRNERCAWYLKGADTRTVIRSVAAGPGRDHPAAVAGCMRDRRRYPRGAAAAAQAPPVGCSNGGGMVESL